MIVCIVDIGGIVDHHCLNFLFVISYDWTMLDSTSTFLCTIIILESYCTVKPDFKLFS